MKKIYIAISLFLLNLPFVNAQGVHTFNYVDVNEDAFTISTAQTGGNFLNAYNLSVLDLAQRVSDVINLGENNKDYFFNNYIKATKVFFTPDNCRMVIIQPIYPDPKKRCILLTNGNGENFNWAQTNRIAIDYALRGYVVAYYENAGSKAARYDGKGNTAAFFTAKTINTSGAITAKDKFFATIITNLFISNSARKLMVDYSNKLTIDTTKFMMVGGSLGACASLYYTYANEKNFSAPMFDKIRKNLNYNQPFNNDGIVAVTAYGGGLPGPNEGLGNIIDGTKNRPAFFFSGSLDAVVNPNKTTILGPENWGPLALKSIYDANNIKYNIYINAYGIHVFQSPSFNQTWGSLPNLRTTRTENEVITQNRIDEYVKANLAKLMMYQYENTQMYEAGKLSATYFNNTVNNTVPNSSVTYVEPKCLQNTIIYQYSIGKLSIEKAVKCYVQNANSAEINRNLDKITTTCLDGTFIPYSKGATAPVISDNFMAPGKGLVKIANFLEVLNKLKQK